jgi:predicted ester cyclase
MDSEAAVRQFYRALSTGDAGLLDEVLAEDWQDIPLPPGTGPGRESFKTQGLGWVRATFPDFVAVNQDVIISADGSKVVVRSVSGGTHAGELFGIAGTGKKVEFSAIDIHELTDGVIVRTWHLEDFLGVVMQLGGQVVPPRGAEETR